VRRKVYGSEDAGHDKGPSQPDGRHLTRMKTYVLLSRAQGRQDVYAELLGFSAAKNLHKPGL